MSTSNPPSPSSSSSLPPEALALATRMFTAARTGDPSSHALLSAALQHNLPANLTNSKGDTLLMLASYHGHAPLVRLLLDHGADPDRCNDRGQSPLAGCVFKAERECVMLLLEGGADPRGGRPSALECCDVFRQEEYRALFEEQVRKLESGEVRVRGRDGAGNTNGNGHANGAVINANGNGDAEVRAGAGAGAGVNGSS